MVTRLNYEVDKWLKKNSEWKDGIGATFL
jgi:hypothetical protein